MKLSEVKRHLRVYWKFIKVFLKSRLIYPKDTILGLFSQLIALAASLGFLTLIFTQVESLQGWSFNEMLLLAGVGGLILNIHHVFFFALYELGDKYIINGKFDRLKLRPLNLLFQVYSGYMAYDNLSKAVANLALVVYAVVNLSIEFGIVQVVYFLTAVVNGVMVIASMFVVLSTTAFWTGRSKSVFWMFFNVSDFRKYPFDIYGNAVKILLLTAFPLAFMSYLPTAFLLGEQSYETLQLATLVSGPVFFLLAYQFWRLGVKKYSSTGS